MKATLKLGLFGMLLLIAVTGCSGAHNPPTTSVMGSHVIDTGSYQGKSIIGEYTIVLDTINLTAGIIPNRAISKHWNVAPMVLSICPTCVSVKVVGFDPVERIFSVEVTLINPTSITAYAVKGVIFLDGTGEYDLENPDAYTGLWTEILSPFRYFARDIPDIAFTGSAEHTEVFDLYISQEHTPLSYIPYVLDASWPAVQKEPTWINNVEVVESAGIITIGCDVIDPQGDVERVWADTVDLIGEETDFINTDGDHWEGTLDGSLVINGFYSILINAKSFGIDILLHNYAEALIEGNTIGILEGRVFDAISAVNAEGTLLTITSTDSGGFDPEPIEIPSSGEYFYNLSAGHYEIEVTTHNSSEDYDTMDTIYDVTNDAGSHVVIDFALGPSYLNDITEQLCCINGRVFDAITGEPIDKASVSISGGDQTGGVFQNRVTDENGHYVFWKVPTKGSNGQPIQEFTIRCFVLGYMLSERTDVPYGWNKNTPQENFYLNPF